MEDSYKWFMDGSSGIDVRSPMRTAVLTHVLVDTPSRKITWAEKKKDVLIEKILKKQVRWNRFMRIAGMLLFCPLSATILFLIAYLLHADGIAGSIFGYNIAASWIVIWMLLEDRFPTTNIYWIKHKGKKYRP